MKFCSVRKFYSFILLATLTALLSLTAACGSGGSVDTSPESNPPVYSWWEGYYSSESSLIQPDTLAAWIDNGFKTADGSPVVVFDVMTDYSSATAPKITGSVSKAAISTFSYNDNRLEGPLDTRNYQYVSGGNIVTGHGASSAMMITGERIDAMIQDLGITEKTVIVLTGTGSGNQFDVWRTYWIFSYWGFSKSKIKVLDGGTAAFAADFPALAPINPYTNLYDPADSSFSVRQLPRLNSELRASIKEVIDAVKDGSPIIFAQATSAGSRNIKTEHSFFLGAGSVHVNGKFNDAEAIKATIMANINASYDADSNPATVTTWDDVLALFKGKTIYVHCGAGFSASALYTTFVDVLGIPVVLYDGSNNQWNAYKADGPLQGLIPDYDTSLYSFSATGGQTALVGDPGVFVDWNYTGTGNEIFEEDYEYHITKPSAGGNEGVQDGSTSGC